MWYDIGSVTVANSKEPHNCSGEGLSKYYEIHVATAKHVVHEGKYETLYTDVMSEIISLVNSWAEIRKMDELDRKWSAISFQSCQESFTDIAEFGVCTRKAIYNKG